MKKLFLILIAVLLCASFAEAYVYRTIGKVNPRGRLSGAFMTSFAEQGGLGATKLTWHPNTVDSREALSARPFTPGVLQIEVKRKAPTSPPITEGVTVLVTAIYPDGMYENFGTSDIEGIMPSNVLAFDHSPSVQAYTNINAPAKGNVNTRVQYLAFVKYGDQSRVFGAIVNIR
jgi:hypothetical protein